MSYWIELVDPVSKETLQLDNPHYMRGATYAIGGTTMMELSITYNYARWYYKPGVFAATKEESEGIRTIYGMSGAQSIPVLEKAIRALEEDPDDMTPEEIAEYAAHDAGGYWTPTKANAIKPLYQLLALARMRPDGVWDGD